jgi:hypothetical protein
MDVKYIESLGMSVRLVTQPITSVPFENRAIRVWAVSVQPGSKQPWHRHLLPYLIVPLTAPRLARL